MLIVIDEIYFSGILFLYESYSYTIESNIIVDSNLYTMFPEYNYCTHKHYKKIWQQKRK